MIHMGYMTDSWAFPLGSLMVCLLIKPMLSFSDSRKGLLTSQNDTNDTLVNLRHSLPPTIVNKCCMILYMATES